jgi:hypothetical protein
MDLLTLYMPPIFVTIDTPLATPSALLEAPLLRVPRFKLSSPPAPPKANLLLLFLQPRLQNTCRAFFSRLDSGQLAPPTIRYEDNASAIRMINNNRPTERSHHIDIAWFAIQDWRAAGDVVLKHIKGTMIIPSQ